MKSINLILSLVIVAATQASCMGQAKKTASPAGYEFSNPNVIKLPNKVDQISGMAYDEKDKAVYAIDDDHGNLYKIPLQESPAVEQWEFGKDRDYEDLVLWNNTIYVLNSRGKIVYFPLSFPITNTGQADLPIKGKNEFEILFKDPSANRLLMMCKDCEGDKKNRLSVYAFDLANNSFETAPVAALNVKEIEAKLDERIGRFKPSAASINPQTGDLYIVSSINKVLVVTGKDFSVKEVVKLDRQHFKQPEGLCFTPSGDLLISNEAGTQGKANILLFRRKP